MTPPEPPAPKRRIGRGLLVGYLVLLALSHGVRWLREPPPTPAGRQVLSVPMVVDGVEALAVAQQEGSVGVAALPGAEPRIDLAYFEWGPEASPADGSPAPVILLVHGSPGDGGNFDQLGPMLAQDARVIAPDMPGFGASTTDVPDYSIRAHAVYCLALLDALGIDAVHAVGFSMGGGVVLHLEEIDPQRIRSLTLLSAIGVQELELLGQYHLNHALHGLQLGAFWVLKEGFPHFGALDRMRTLIPYARNFFDTDQRPLRGLLEQTEAPFLIVHGEGDVLVPVAAAREHARIVPQSELVITDANHFMVFRSPEQLAAIEEFVRRVEAGEALTRAQASAERRAAANDPQGFRPPKITGFALTITFVLLALATLVSEDLACIAAGLLVARGSLDLVTASLACGSGIFFGDLGLYALGRLGRPWLHRAPLRWFVAPRSVARSERWFAQRGPMVIFLSRFMPGMRLPTYVAAGLLQMGFWRYTLSLLIPVAIWTPLLVAGSQQLGDRVFERFEVFQRYALPGFVAALVSLWILLALVRSLTSWRGRRGWVGWWKRTTEWEFWPRWAFYPPVVLGILRLAWRYKAPTLFTAANPGMPAGGGFVGESKSEILDQIDPDWVARYEALPGAEVSFGERRTRVDAFRERLGLELPLVLKPDQGERGTGVTIARTDEAIDAFLRQQTGKAILQEYIAGPELGVFYVRLPEEAKGRIFSITEKLLPTILGDGHSTVEHLILADPRAVAMAPVYLNRLQDRLDTVPAEGELVSLASLGTHCRGAVFLDGVRYKSDAMEDAFDRIAKSFEGFYFGRFDVRAPSIDAFREGRDFKVLELNGVTSEATHIYDPKHRLSEAHAILHEQWRLAYEIGRQNRKRGVEPLSFFGFLRLVLAPRQR